MHGRIFIPDRDVNGDNRIDIDDMQWNYLDGDGDFRSKEITQLRDEADFIITNPPDALQDTQQGKRKQMMPHTQQLF